MPLIMFQSTSSEEDVVSIDSGSKASLVMFQSTSSEEDVVSIRMPQEDRALYVSIHVLRRGRCVRMERLSIEMDMMFQSTSSEEDVVSCFDASHCRIINVSIHVLRRGRCVSALW